MAEVVRIVTQRTRVRFLNGKTGNTGRIGLVCTPVNSIHTVDVRGGGAEIGIPFPRDVEKPRMIHCVGGGVFLGIGVPAVGHASTRVAVSA